MKENNTVIALVGAGTGGCAILQTLLSIPTVTVRYVCDIDPDAPGIEIAQQNSIDCLSDPCHPSLESNPEIDLLLEVTGRKEVYEQLQRNKSPSTVLVGAGGTKIIFHLLDTQAQIQKELKKYKERLEAGIIERTEELEQANRALKNKILEYEMLNDKLQQINNEKTKYLLRATHQLKAPFAAIQSYTDILLGGYTGELPEKTAEIVGKIKVRCELLQKSIREMLELANLKSCITENIKFETVSFRRVILDAIGHNKELASARNVEIISEFADASHEIRANRDQLFTLLNILIENAVNYSHENSKVEITSKLLDGRLKLSIRDYGIGINEKHLENIFKEYFRTNEATNKHENGSGLGLAIAEQIARIHHFTLDVQSGLGEGSTFSISAPLSD